MKKYDLEERLIQFAVSSIKIAEKLPKSKAGLHISGQLVRSGTSPAYNYGEAQGAESMPDFCSQNENMPERITGDSCWFTYY